MEESMANTCMMGIFIVGGFLIIVCLFLSTQAGGWTDPSG